MRALRWHGRGDIRMDDIPHPPDPAEGQVQVRVLWCGICGTDIEEWLHGPVFIPESSPNRLTGGQAPLVLGHEVTGEVVALGNGVDGFALGDVVAIDGLVSCGTCYWCVRDRPVLCPELSAIGLMCDGGLAEFCNVPAKGCFTVPESLAADEATLAETLAVGVRALHRGRLVDGESVAIFGAGAVGLLAAQAAVAKGARSVTVIDPIAERRTLATQLATRGDVRAFESAESAGLTDIDLAVECSGNPTAVASALGTLRRGGRLVLVGISTHPVTLTTTDIVIRETEIIGSLSHVYNQDFGEAVRLMSAGLVVAGPLVTSRRPLSQAIDAFQLAADAPADYLKILISPSEVLT